jgi:hypothetical protein
MGVIVTVPKRIGIGVAFAVAATVRAIEHVHEVLVVAATVKLVVAAVNTGVGGGRGHDGTPASNLASSQSGHPGTGP